MPLTGPAFTANPTNDDDAGDPEEGVGLCLSGGGYRAMLFHVGTLWRLYEVGKLKDISRISSVSGGSITAGVLALAWPKLSFDPAAPTDFIDRVVDPVRRLAGHTIDVGAIVGGIALPGSIADRVASAYRKHLFGEATLQDLPDTPRFVINATSVQTGALWRFSKPYMADYHIGLIENPTIDLAVAVAASSAFPPILSPMTITLDPKSIKPDDKADLHDAPFTDRAVLCDGGVYDNLGLETVWKNFTTVLVSDAGAKIAPEGSPQGDWAHGAMRILDLIDNQVRALRKRQLIGSYYAAPESAEHRKGAYWSIRSNIAKFAAGSSLTCPITSTAALAVIPTRLEKLDASRQEKLINWGYAICDAALRTHLDPNIPAATKFPYALGV